MRLTLKHLDGRDISSITTPCDERTEWILSTIEREFECVEDDISFDENEDLGDVILVRGEPVARMVSYIGWNAI